MSAHCPFAAWIDPIVAAEKLGAASRLADLITNDPTNPEIDALAARMNAPAGVHRPERPTQGRLPV